MDNSSETFFSGIERLESKSNLIINLTTGKISKAQYWDYELKLISGERSLLKVSWSYFMILSECD